MRLGLNILYLIPGAVGGTETYARELIGAITKQLKPTDQLLIYATPQTAQTFARSPNVRIVSLPISSTSRVVRLLAEQFLLPLYLRRDRLDVIFSLGYSAPVFHSCPSLVTIHDLNWYYHPEDFNPLTRLVWNVLTRLTAISANYVLTDSAASLLSLNQVLKPRRASMVLHATPSKVRPVKPNFALPPRYLFTVSASYPHKNLRTLIKVFNTIAKSDHSLSLVICGLSGLANSDLGQLIATSPAAARIVRLGYITRPELSYVYSHASVFVFPSAYEGFGYPVLEAMSYGVPVVSSNATSLSEVVGDGGILVDPFDVDAYVTQIKRLLSSAKARASLIAKGYRRCAQLTWDKTARSTLAIIRGL